VAALVLWTLALFLVLAIASFPEANWVGPVGQVCARGLVSLVGVVAWALPLELVLLGIPFVRSKESAATPGRVAGDLLMAVVAAALVQVGWQGRTAFGGMAAGGLVGELFGEVARSLFSTAGSFLVGFACLGLVLIGRAAFSFIAFARLVARVATGVAVWTAGAMRALREAWTQAKALERERDARTRAASMPRIVAPADDEVIVAAPPDPDEESVADALAEAGEKPARRKRKAKSETPVDVTEPVGAGEGEIAKTPRRQGAKDSGGEKSPAVANVAVGSAAESASDSDSASVSESGSASASGSDSDSESGSDSESESASESKSASPPPATPASALTQLGIEAPARPRRSRKTAPTIVDTSAALSKEEARPDEAPAPQSSFELPSVDMLAAEKVNPTAAIDHERLLANAGKLVETLAHYGVQGKVEDILPGPTVTTYEVSPAVGTKVSKVAGLADDLALALARKVRIVAPIPGKNRIGFELPNETRVPVVLRELIEDRRFQTLAKPLPVVLGRDIQGHPVYADLASMPHVIVAGATGAGKSVGLNVMLLSLLYRRTPDELRLLMVDPKVVELAPFDRIPHMLLPVVTDMKQAATALKWAVDEMERRYQLFADAGTKNVATYNAWVEKVVAGEVKNPNAPVVVAKDHNGLPEEIPPEKGSTEGVAPLPEKLPWIVIVVDEFADLMMQQGKEVEAAVARLAQKARAAGMHVVLATQRPSVDVITGVIKANFPTRIAYRVSQKVDSRTILDEQGAEHLLGMGDMLIKMNGTNDTKRVQCPWVSEEEVQRVTDFLRSQGEPTYDDNILRARDDDEEDPDVDAPEDPMYEDAVNLVRETQRCSTSWLQRKLQLGYNRAARIVEMMERRGLVGPANGAKDREVLMPT
jgi:S-DNA-T family DNA segregation ATPase FtsK/SpoIIIE